MFIKILQISYTFVAPEIFCHWQDPVEIALFDLDLTSSVCYRSSAVMTEEAAVGPQRPLPSAPRLPDHKLWQGHSALWVFPTRIHISSKRLRPPISFFQTFMYIRYARLSSNMLYIIPVDTCYTLYLWISLLSGFKQTFLQELSTWSANVPPTL